MKRRREQAGGTGASDPVRPKKWTEKGWTGVARWEGWNKGLFRAGDRVCCAVSGGADSVALLLALVDANAEEPSLGAVLSAVHVHHGLRAAEADADQDFVRELCGRSGVPLIVEHVDTPARQAAEREGVEEAARALRYEVFRALLFSGSVDSVATGHNLDDQAETVIMKLMRGAWTEGIGGIQPVLAVSPVSPVSPVSLTQGQSSSADGGPATPSPGSQGRSGRIVRPFLGVRRREIEVFLRKRGQSWREDTSNADLRLTRNRVRHQLMPELRRFNPGLDELLGRTAAIARDEELYWQKEIARLLPSLLLPGKPVRGGGRAVATAVGERATAMDLDRLRGLHAAVRRRVVRAAAGSLGCRLSSDETAKLLALAGLEPYPGLTGRIGARLELAGGLRAERSARELRLSRSGTPKMGKGDDLPPKM